MPRHTYSKSNSETDKHLSTALTDRYLYVFKYKIRIEDQNIYLVQGIEQWNTIIMMKLVSPGISVENSKQTISPSRATRHGKMKADKKKKKAWKNARYKNKNGFVRLSQFFLLLGSLLMPEIRIILYLVVPLQLQIATSKL